MSATRHERHIGTRTLFAALATLAAFVAAGGTPAVAAVSAAPSSRPVNPGTGLPAGVTPKTGTSRPRNAAPAGAHLSYYGGKVISNVQVVQVLYGSGTYTSEVQNTAAPSVASFYTGVTNSSYFDWLSEYNTTVSGGTQQHIGRGSFVQQVQITPAAANNGSVIDDTNIQAELKAQVAAGHLPAPTANTMYTLYFPAGKTITQGGSSSGVQFCAYHGTTSGPELFYSVLPDFTTGGMTSGCGGGTRFQNETSVSSHELIETVTDAEVGLATVVGAPLAWYDSTNGEIGDICNAQQQAITGGDGRTYTVQQEWSNAQNACVVHGPAVANDFSLALSPTALSVVAGAGGTSTVSTAVTAGSAGSVVLSSAGVPSGVTVSLSPGSVTAGSSSTLTVSTTSAVAAGTYPITVTGTEGSATHSATLTLTVTNPSGGGITNGGFETGTTAGWVAAGATSVISGGAQSGTYSARVGTTTPTGDSSLSQTFTVPASGVGLQFAYNITCPDTITYDWATATLKDNTTGATTTPLPKTCVNPTSGWRVVSAPVTAGHSYTLTLSNHDDNWAGDPTYTQYDSVVITTAVPGGTLTNGGFETGTLSGWTSGGASTGVRSPGHTGTYAAMVGGSGATNGDSTISQTFTIPAGKATLGLWYSMSCPDTVTYDWATVTLKDNTAGTTTTVLPKKCASSTAWTAVTSAVIAGHSYTLTLLSHDDNYAGDPTYTLYDDVALS